MTNKEYIEKNKISFSDAMKMYDNEKYPCINDWLNQEHFEWMFEQGDVIVYKEPVKFRNNHVYFIVDIDSDYIYVKEVNRNGNILYWYGMTEYNNKHKEDHSIKIIHKHKQDYFRKIA